MRIDANTPITDPLCAYLVENKLMTPMQWNLAWLQHEATGERLPMVIRMMGFVPYDDVIAAMLTLRSEDLLLEECFSAQVSSSLLQDLKTMVIAEQGNTLYVATPQSLELVKDVLEQTYPHLIFKFLPCDSSRLKDYLLRLPANTEQAQLLETLLNEAAFSRVSDIHIIPKESSFLVMYRYLGTRMPVHEGTLQEYSYLSSRIKDRATMDLAERRVPQDGSFSFKYESRQINVRVASTPTIHGETIVIRLLDPKSAAPNLNSLGLTRLDHWTSGVSRPDGLCIVCGPTGSGKSTTLNSSIQTLNRVESAIYTLEDPIEARTPLIGQVQVNRLVGLDFPQGVRAMMRLDPDIIVIGEIRDEQTAKAAIAAAETGHLVLATLHSHSILGAFRRLNALGVSSSDLMPLMRSVLAQRLIRQTCAKCNGSGCDSCKYTGFSNRTLVSECAYFSDEEQVAAAIEGHRDWPTMLEDAVLKVKRGITTKAEVLRVFGAEAQSALDALPEELP